MKTSKDKYRELYNERIPIFLQAWWLDIVCGKENWEVCLYLDTDKKYLGSLVYYYQKKHGIKLIKMPQMTSYSGLWIKRCITKKNHSLYSKEKKIIDVLIQQLPKFDLFYQQLHPAITNGLPLFWSGFKLSYRYTYLLKLSEEDTMYNNLKGSIRTDLKHAKQYLTISELKDIGPFIDLVSNSFVQKGKPNPYDFNILSTLDEQLQQRNSRKILAATDSKGDIHAAAYFIHDHETVYYYIGARDTQKDQHNGLSLVLWNAIKGYAADYEQLDFEGSIIPEIEFFFRAFGGDLVPHIKLTKTRNKLFHIISLFLGTEYH